MKFMNFAEKFDPKIKWDASSRWSFGPNSAWNSIDDDHSEDAPHFMNIRMFRVSNGKIE